METSNTTNPLVNVEFVDETNYVNPASTDDIVGAVVESVWGVPDTPTVLTSESWRSFASLMDSPRVNQSFATVQRLFDAGADYVAVVRPSVNEKYLLAVGTVTGSALTIEATQHKTDEEDDIPIEESAISDDPTALFAVRYKYPGGVPFKLTVTPLASSARKPNDLKDVPLFTMAFYLNGATAPTESFLVAFTEASAQGESYFYADVINSSSLYFVASSAVVTKLAPDAIAGISAPGVLEINETNNEDMFADDGSGIFFPAKLTAQDYINAYEKFRDRSQSSVTLLVSTYDPNAAKDTGGTQKGPEDVYATISDIANTRKDCNALIGCPKSLFNNADEATVRDNIRNHFTNNLNASFMNSLDMFTDAIAAVEKVTVRNKSFFLDGTATWAARTAVVAKTYKNRNRLASYLATGQTSAVLVKSLQFATVVELMSDYGIGSIYKATTGNYIFSIRSQYANQSSYFGKMNVMRVTAALLSWLLTDVEYVIHTEVTSDATERLSFQEQCNTKLGQMIARGELKSESFISCGDDINTDALTQGGECLNIEAELWFKKLTERVKIKITATDSSVTVTDISQE